MFRLILAYFVWHYTRGFKDIFNLFTNFVWFIYHFFSIKVLTKTLFNPWKKHQKSPHGDLHALKAPIVFIKNFLMRMFGFFIRLFIITLGLILSVLTFILGIVVTIVWAFLPFIIGLLFVSGIRLLI